MFWKWAFPLDSVPIYLLYAIRGYSAIGPGIGDMSV